LLLGLILTGEQSFPLVRPQALLGDEENPMTRRITPLALAALALAVSAAPADEGMWLFNQPPRKLLKDRHRFDATDAWLDHLQKSSVRFNNGGSGSFVSPDGLVMTNHHIARGSVAKLRTQDKNYVRDGFYPQDPADELQS